MIALRDYQGTAVDGVRAAYRSGARAPLLVLPTGGGKTVVFSHIAQSAAERGNTVLVLAHRRELIRQASAKLRDAGVAHGIIAPGHTPTRDACQVASVQTLGRRLSDPRYPEPSLIIIDEAHHAVAGQWATICASYPRARLLGVTATPQRMDGQGLGTEAGGPFDSLVVGPSMADLIERGFLSPCRVFAPAEAPDLSGVRTRGGDYETGALADAMSAPRIVGNAVEHYARHTPGLPAILFSPSVAHAEATAEAFRAAGWRAVAASGTTDPAERDAAIAGLATGAVQVLCSCDLISEGLDVPAVSTVILLRPTKSLGLFLQQVGRGLRPAPGKTALTVLDHAGNTLTHGMPDAPREWTLAGRAKGKKKEQPPASRQCPDCFAVTAPLPVCPECGHQFVTAAREIEVVDGTLSEIDADRLTALRQTKLHVLLKDARTEADLREISKAKGYKRGWVEHVLASRGERRDARSHAA
ncbi:SSL2 DNA or RNA helicases of superfamily II [uncultured Caudovirales phage]|uniref:SSL2 DNA or RNA helicases of superfamily II n=1 Tax=uncultured Caudovirales phage TaxID=2100421 RepID=A0A6J5KXW4_9CAUD|nr:SSL2 DNA or RNA helicases of superfamily II [uncultured Caudovirales phage]